MNATESGEVCGKVKQGVQPFLLEASIGVALHWSRRGIRNVLTRKFQRRNQAASAKDPSRRKCLSERGAAERKGTAFSRVPMSLRLTQGDENRVKACA
jgi:hypothetical protein